MLVIIINSAKICCKDTKKIVNICKFEPKKQVNVYV